jgi:lipopolysaccharide transport system permease protein
VLTYIRNLLQFRELLYFFVLREIKAKYKQAILGVAWAFLQPLALLGVFTVVFSYFARLPSDGVPYAIFSYCAILPWQFFATVLSRGTSSLLSHQALVQKVYFPREIIPLAVIAAAVVDFTIGGIVFWGLLWFYGIPWTLTSLLIVPVFAIQLTFSIGIVLVLAPLNIFYRDVGLLLPLMVQIWMYATPIIYPLSLVPGQFRPLYMLNPMVGIVEAYRRLLLHGALPDAFSLIVATCVSLGTLTFGLFYFKKVEFKLADVL